MSTPPELLVAPLDTLSDQALSDRHDALIVVAPASMLSALAGKSASSSVPPPAYLRGAVRSAILEAIEADASLGRGARAPVVLPANGLPGGRLVLAPLGALSDDTDDARLVAEATAVAMNRAVDAGARAPLISVSVPDQPKFARAAEVAALAAMGTQWAPLEAREAEKAPAAARSVAVLGLDEATVARIAALELGRYLSRDITGTEPERMAPLRIAALCEKAFQGTTVSVKVEREVAGYPLLAAVARASQVVERHRPCVVELEYRPKGEIKRTVILAGKGVTYDTGGADLKTDGHMAGMSRDKGGAGVVAGLMRAVSALELPGVRVIALLGLVRNSIGEDAFVSDEIIRSRAGVRVRIGNTDAEGRLVLADLLARAKDLASGEPDPVIFSVATLTGHVYRAYGPYTGAVGNGPARSRGEVDALDALGELWAEPFERSRPRREDFAAVAPRGSAEDVVSANRLASVATSRGHQLPYAFLDIASGLKGGALPFIHLDIAGTAVEGADWQFGRPTGAPIATLAAYLGRFGQ
jgi:leucyl aminopeptidase